MGCAILVSFMRRKGNNEKKFFYVLIPEDNFFQKTQDN